MGFRLGGIRDWQAKWYAEKHYAEFLQEDLKLRGAIQSGYTEAGISQVQIARQTNAITITIYTARPGVVIGRGGQRVDKMRHHLESLIGKRVQLNIQEIQQPELDAYLVARTIADQIENRISYRRAMKQAIARTIMAGAKGIRVKCSGRLGGAEIARRLTMHEGRVPLQTLRADIDYGFTEARTLMGRIGVKAWIYKGDILPERELVAAEEAVPELVASKSAEVAPAVAEPVAVASTEVAPEVKPEKLVAPVSAEVAPAVAEPVATVSPEAVPEAKPEKPAAMVSAEAVPKAKRKKAVAAVSTEAKGKAKPKAKPKVKPEEKPVKPRTRRRKTTTGKTKEAEASKPSEKEVKDATTQAGEIPQES
jgi:small subunit ribosomal protein S3